MKDEILSAIAVKLCARWKILLQVTNKHPKIKYFIWDEIQ
jgi:hypothetical protein